MTIYRDAKQEERAPRYAENVYPLRPPIVTVYGVLEYKRGHKHFWDTALGDWSGAIRREVIEVVEVTNAIRSDIQNQLARRETY